MVIANIDGFSLLSCVRNIISCNSSFAKYIQNSNKTQTAKEPGIGILHSNCIPFLVFCYSYSISEMETRKLLYDIEDC